MMKHKRFVWRTGLVAGALILAGALLASVSAAPSGITWGPLRRGNFQSTAYYKASIQPTVDVSTDGISTFIHSLDYSDYDTVSGTYAWPYCKAGKPLPLAECPYSVGIFYNRSSNLGMSWLGANAVRLNPDDQDGARPTITADGANVVAAWASQPEYYTAKVGTGPRVLYVRANNNYGDSASWAPMQAITSLKGRVDYPWLASGGGRIYLGWTDSNKGDIHVATSLDGGVTWAGQIIAKTTALLKGPYPYGPNGYGARPAIGVSDDGMTVGVAYLMDKKVHKKHYPCKLMGIASLDGGATWQGGTTIANRIWIRPNGPTSEAGPTASGATDRVGVAWIDATQTKGMVIEYRKVGGWQPAVQAATPDGTVVKKLYTIYPGLQGASTVGVAYGGCGDPCKDYKGTGISMMWSESADSGTTWTDPDTLWTGGTSGSNLFSNFAPTVVWNGDKQRHVMWQGYNINWWNYIRGYKVGTTP